jgi:hypothetical protein
MAVIPAGNAGIQVPRTASSKQNHISVFWIPAFPAGMTPQQFN